MWQICTHQPVGRTGFEKQHTVYHSLIVTLHTYICKISLENHCLDLDVNENELLDIGLKDMKQDLPAAGLIISGFLPFLFPNSVLSLDILCLPPFSRKGLHLIANTIRYLAKYGDSLTNSVVSLGPESNKSRTCASL
jgi:hypothetical protein